MCWRTSSIVSFAEGSHLAEPVHNSQEEPVRRVGTGLQGHFNFLLYFPSEGSKQLGRRKDGI